MILNGKSFIQPNQAKPNKPTNPQPTLTNVNQPRKKPTINVSSPRYAGSVWRSTITVMQLATLDLWSEVRKGFSMVGWLRLVEVKVGLGVKVG